MLIQHSLYQSTSLRCCGPKFRYIIVETNRKFFYCDMKSDQTFPRPFIGHRKDVFAQRCYIKETAAQLGYPNPSDWYHLRSSDFDKRLLSSHKGSLVKALQTLFPSYNWKVWKFSKVPSNFWKVERHQLEFLEWFSKTRCFQSLDDWYNIKTTDVAMEGAGGLLEQHQFSLVKALSFNYPHHCWHVWRFEKVPQNYWNEALNRREFLDAAARHFGLRSLYDWHYISVEQIEEFGGHGLLRNAGGSMTKLLISTYPEYSMWRFTEVPKNVAYDCWTQKQKERDIFLRIGEQLHLTCMEDWYNVRLEDLEKRGISLSSYENSLLTALRSVFDDHQWYIWKFPNVRIPHEIWDDEKEVREYLRWITEKLEMVISEDWIRVSNQHIYILNGSGLIQKFGSLRFILNHYFPNTMRRVQQLKLSNLLSKEHFYLYSTVRSLFVEMEVIANHNHSNLLYSQSAKNIELDLFLPQLNLALEYQGPQHYHWHFIYGNPQEQQRRDQERREKCDRYGISLVEIPFWWKGNRSILIAMIRRSRPDLLLQYAQYAIPLDSILERHKGVNAFGHQAESRQWNI